MSKEKTLELVPDLSEEPTKPDEVRQALEHSERKLLELSAQIGGLMEQLEATRKQRDAEATVRVALMFALEKTK